MDESTVVFEKSPLRSSLHRYTILLTSLEPRAARELAQDPGVPKKHRNSSLWLSPGPPGLFTSPAAASSSLPCAFADCWALSFSLLAPSSLAPSAPGMFMRLE